MNVTIEHLSGTKKRLRIQVPAAEVDTRIVKSEKDYQKVATLPGFRPGKAPLAVVARKYEAEILDEAKGKLLNETFKQAVTDEKLDVLGYPKIEEQPIAELAPPAPAVPEGTPAAEGAPVAPAGPPPITFARGKDFFYVATVEVEPQFELPEYKGLAVKREARSVSDEDVGRALDLLREKQVSYETVARPVQMGDIAVVNYTGTSEGQPLTALAPTARGLTEQKAFWIEMQPGAFIPGFAEQLQGAQAGEHRTVTVDFPADFVAKELAGKRGVYATELVEVKERRLPPLDEELAKKFGAASLEALKAGVRKDLENELGYSQAKVVRNQLVRALLDRVTFELPESSVAQATRNIVYDIVQENQKRGISRNQIEGAKDQIYSAATRGAQERVKVAFLLQKIAEKEDIKVSQEEILRRITALANVYGIAPEKFIKDLQKRNGIVEIYDQVANEKVLDFLEQQAQITEVPVGSMTPQVQTPPPSRG